MRALAAMSFVLAGVCLAVGVLGISNLFDDYKDSPDSTYVETAAVPLALAVVFLACGTLALRRRAS